MSDHPAWHDEKDIEHRLLARQPDPSLDDLFGPALHAELRELARAARRPRGGPRVLILPGIMGSTLGLRGEDGDDVKWFDPLEVVRGKLTDLALPSSLPVEPLGVLLFAYLRLKLSLRAAGFEADFHPYDWRLSVHDSGLALAARIDAEPRRRVLLVAHSMGGLVARAALAHRGAERIERVVQLGTPNRGAYAAVQALRGSYPLVRRLALLDLRHDARQLARKLLCTLPGLVELLPSADDCEDCDPFDAAHWPEGPTPRPELLAESAEALSSLPLPDGRFVLVAGTGRETLTGLRRIDGRLEYRRDEAGDGTVPLALARLPGLATWTCGQSHGALASDAEVTRAVIDLLNRGDTDLLPRAGDVLGRGPSRWVGEEAPEPAEASQAWEALSPAERREILHEFVAIAEPTVRHDDDSSTTLIDFVLGDVAAAEAEAIALGLFSNVDPAGAAAGIDRLLGGAIRDLSRRRALAARAGEVTLLPVSAPGLAPRLVAFAGLGPFQRYGAGVQRMAAANLARMMDLAGVRDYALVPWGTASGSAVDTATTSLIAGLLEALEGLPTERRPRRIALHSRSAHRLGLARQAIEAQLGRHPHGALLRLGQAPNRGASLAAPSPATTTQCYLFVQQEGSTLRAALLGHTAKATALAGERRLALSELDEQLAGLVEAPDHRTILRFGERLARQLLPDVIHAALPQLGDAPLVVVHDAPASRWPWETLAIGSWTPAIASGLSRRYAAEGMPLAKWSAERRRGAALEVLLVTDPTEDLPGAREEGRAIEGALTGDGIRITRLRGSEATRARLLEEFASEAWDVIHYAGHAFFDPGAPGASGIYCAGGRVLSGDDLASLGALPALVCFNACESGRLRKATPAPRLRALRRGAGLAEAFLLGGVANFIGTWWPVGDEAAASFAGALYRGLARGDNLGTSMRAARAAVQALDSGDWANYLLYGSEDFRLRG
ncbi:MAG: CHAT domain-containing protein [Steroidobacteraceae bacterium]